MRLGRLVTVLPVGYQQALRGLASYFREEKKGTGGSNSGAYCYSVYLRHLVKATQRGLCTNPRTVAELGPGDSLGVGIAALLCGAENYFAFDAIRHADVASNLYVFDELVEMFRSRRAFNREDPDLSKIQPRLDSYEFPGDILTFERMELSLNTERINKIRRVLQVEDFSSPESPIRYFAPYVEIPSSLEGTVDLLLSQAAMEHVDELFESYRYSSLLLADGGFASHQIDMGCHDTALEWNGHWEYPKLFWRIIRGRRKWLINRFSYSDHIRLLKKSGFEIVNVEPTYEVGGLSRKQLAREFRRLSDEDMRVSSAFIQVIKTQSTELNEQQTA